MRSESVNPYLVSLQAPGSFAAEQYQGLRMTVERLKALRDVKVVAVTSPGAGEGKTVTSINLAAALAHGSDPKVLLIDADLRRPNVAARLDIEDGNERGLIEAITTDALRIGDIARTVKGSAVRVVPAGMANLPVHEILRSPRLERVLSVKCVDRGREPLAKVRHQAP